MASSLESLVREFKFTAAHQEEVNTSRFAAKAASRLVQ
jgi:hypothetical protein